MKRSVVAVLVLVGCKYPDPGMQMPADDEPPRDGDVDDTGDGPPGDESSPLPCVEPGSIDNMFELPGKTVAGFSPAEDESFAISWLSGMVLGYTEGPNLGDSYSPTDIPDAIARAHMSPDGQVVYYFAGSGPSGQRLRRVANNGSPAEWNASIWSGISEGFPGRPTADDQRMFYDQDLVPTEAMRMAGTWTNVRSYTPEDFGNESGSTITSGNLSPDGNFLVYTLTGPTETGIHLRVRVNETFDVDDGSYGRGLLSGPYRDAVLVQHCTRLYVLNESTGHVERWDVHPVVPI